MSIEYTIDSFHAATGSIQVRFHNLDIPEGIVFSITLPLNNGQYPRGEELDSLIRSHTPVDIFERAKQLKQDAPAPPVESSISESTQRQLNSFGEGRIFIRDGNERIFLTYPLVRSHSLDIPLEVI